MRPRDGAFLSRLHVHTGSGIPCPGGFTQSFSWVTPAETGHCHTVHMPGAEGDRAASLCSVYVRAAGLCSVVQVRALKFFF